MLSSTAQVLDGAKSKSWLGGEFCSLCPPPRRATDKPPVARLGSARLRSPPAGAGAGAFLTWGRQQHAGRAALEAAQQGRGPDAGVEARHGAAQLGAA